jgi:dTDP-4-amino-4,6-dideoxygalactose transaminase
MTSNPPQAALLGGPPIRPEGPPSWPILDAEVLHALESAYGDGSWGKYHGGHVKRLEEELVAYHGLDFALACASGTFAVELALRALKIGPADEVILAAYDYSGNFLNVHAVGATPVLVDVAPDNWNLDLERLTSAITSATRAILVSHLHGGLVPMRELMAHAQAYGLHVIEDAAQATGAMLEGRRAGSWGDIGILSFGGSKLLSAGRGGALLTRHAALYQRARIHVQRGNHLAPLSELQAAVLLPQLEKLDARNEVRSHNVAFLRDRLQTVPGLRLFINAASLSDPAYYKLGIRYDAEAFGLSRQTFVAALQAEGIALDEGFAALHIGRSPSRFRKFSDLVCATRAHTSAIILHHPVLLGTEEDLEQIVAAIAKTHANRELLRQLDFKQAAD